MDVRSCRESVPLSFSGGN